MSKQGSHGGRIVIALGADSMSPSELDEYLLQDPVPPFRLTLASGDQIVVRAEDSAFVSGLSLVLRGEPVTRTVTAESRLISIPNIVLLEPAGMKPPAGGRRR